MPSTNREGTPPSDSAGSLVDGPDTQDCSKHAGGWGTPMTDYEFIWYGNKSESDYPKEACTPYYACAQIDNFKVNILLDGEVILTLLVLVLLEVKLLLLLLEEILLAILPGQHLEIRVLISLT